MSEEIKDEILEFVYPYLENMDDERCEKDVEWLSNKLNELIAKSKSECLK